MTIRVLKDSKLHLFPWMVGETVKPQGPLKGKIFLWLNLVISF